VYVGSCMVCELSYGMWAVEWYVGCCMVYGLLDIRAAVYMGCFMVCGLLNDMWAVVSCVGSCMVCGLL